MSICNSDCITELPCISNAGCNINLRSAGIDRVIFADCAVEFDDITDLAEWTALIAAGRIAFTGQILGQKPKATFTTKKIASCIPEVPVSAEYQISWLDSNADNEAFTDYDFYRYLQANQQRVIAGYYTCDGLLYWGLNRLSLEIDDTRGDNSDEEAVFDVLLRYKTPDNFMLKPVLIANLNSVLVCASGEGEGEGEGEG